MTGQTPLRLGLDNAVEGSHQLSETLGLAPQFAGQGGHMDWGDGGFVTLWITMAVFWLGGLPVAAWAVAVYARRGGSERESPLEIAKARFARGEITAEEF